MEPTPSPSDAVDPMARALMAMQASQAQALARSLRAQSTIRLAYESDSYLVRQFFIDARGTCADARLLCEAALEPLISVLQVAATGELPRAVRDVAQRTRPCE